MQLASVWCLLACAPSVRMFSDKFCVIDRAPTVWERFAQIGACPVGRATMFSSIHLGGTGSCGPSGVPLRWYRQWKRCQQPIRLKIQLMVLTIAPKVRFYQHVHRQIGSTAGRGFLPAPSVIAYQFNVQLPQTLLLCSAHNVLSW
jgi:hypothetical protein